MIDRWRIIPSQPRYEASSEGRIRVFGTGKFVAAQSCGSGRYWKVALFNNGARLDQTVHSLVCEAFHGPRPRGKVCAHINGDGRDNRAQNLEWATPEENEAQKRGVPVISPEARAVIANSAGSVKQVDLAARYGASVSMIQSIQRKARASRLHPTGFDHTIAGAGR